MTTFAELSIGDEFVEDGDRFVKIAPEPLLNAKRKYCGEKGSEGGCGTPVSKFFNARAINYNRRVHFCPNDKVVPVPVEVAV